VCHNQDRFAGGLDFQGLVDPRTKSENPFRSLDVPSWQIARNAIAFCVCANSLDAGSPASLRCQGLPELAELAQVAQYVVFAEWFVGRGQRTFDSGLAGHCAVGSRAGARRLGTLRFLSAT